MFQISVSESSCSKVHCWTVLQWNCVWLTASIKQALKLAVKQIELFLRVWLSCKTFRTSFSRLGCKAGEVFSHPSLSASPPSGFQLFLKTDWTRKFRGAWQNYWYTLDWNRSKRYGEELCPGTARVYSHVMTEGLGHFGQFLPPLCCPFACLSQISDKLFKASPISCHAFLPVRIHLAQVYTLQILTSVPEKSPGCDLFD